MSKIKIHRREVIGQAVGSTPYDFERTKDPVEEANRILAPVAKQEPEKVTFCVAGTKNIRVNGVSHVVRGNVENNFCYSTSNKELIEKMIELGYQKA